jgi:hypothetical protein
MPVQSIIIAMGYQGRDASDQGLRSRPDPDKKGPNITFTVVMVVVVVAMLFMALVALNLRPPEGLDPEPETVVDGVTYIQGDVVWNNRTGFLDGPVVVRSGGRLTVLDSDLAVRLEDLAYLGDPWFQVDPGGWLRFERSHLDIFKDPRLEKAMTLSSYSTGDNPYEVSFLQRAVELTGTTAPQLTFDVRTHAEDTEVVVAYQIEPREDIRTLDRISLTIESRNWTHHEVDLGPLAGSLVMLYIIPISSKPVTVHISDVRLTDGGDPLSIGQTSSGHPLDDLWGVRNADHFLDTLSYQYWPDLIEVEGRLEVVSSRVSGPNDIKRTNNDRIEGLFKLDMEDDWGAKVFRNLGVGGDISVDRGDVVFDRAELDFVTVKALEASVDMVQVTIVGNRELVTMFESSGDILDSTFIMEYDEWNLPPRYWDLDYPHSYGLAVWGRLDTESVLVSRCTFVDTPLGMDLTHANVVVEGCVFQNTSKLAVWNHNTTGMGSWVDINATCDLSEAVGHRYLETHDGHITFTGAGLGGNYSEFDFYEWGSIKGPSWRWRPPVDLIEVEWDEAFLYVPTYSVNSYGTEYPLSEVEVEVETRYAGREVITIDTSGSEFLLEFEAVGNGSPPDEPVVFDDYLIDVNSMMGLLPNGTDTMDVTISVFLWRMMTEYRYPLVSDLELEFLVDGKTHSVHSIPFEIGEEDYPDAVVPETVPAHPGLHVVDVVLRGVVHGMDDPEVISSVNYTFFRADGNVSTDELKDYDDKLYTQVIVDPGVSLDLHVLDLVETIGDYSIVGAVFYLGEGSRVNLTGPIPEDVQAGLEVLAFGNGTLALRDIEAFGGSLTVFDCDVEMSNLSYDYIELSLYNADATIADCAFRHTDSMYFTRANLTILDSHIATNDTYWEINYSNIILEGSEFTGEGTDPFDIYCRARTNLTVEGCVFKDVVVKVWVFNGTPSHSKVINSTFSGDPSGLVIREPSPYLDGLYMYDIYDNITIDGNTFSGPGSSLRALRTVHQLSVGDNAFEDGARRQVLYDLSIDMVPDYYCETAPYPHIALLPGHGHEQVEGIWWIGNETIVRVLTTLEDMSGIDDPWPAQLVITGEDWMFGGTTALYYEEVDLTSGSLVISYPYWGDSRILVKDLMDRLGVDSWWTT